MASNIEERLKIALGELHFAASEVHLETTQSGSVGGHIVSGSFAGKTQMERQDHLWEHLRQALTPEDLTKIVALLTVTPEEIADDK